MLHRVGRKPESTKERINVKRKKSPFSEQTIQSYEMNLEARPRSDYRFSITIMINNDDAWRGPRILETIKYFRVLKRENEKRRRKKKYIYIYTHIVWIVGLGKRLSKVVLFRRSPTIVRDISTNKVQ